MKPTSNSVDPILDRKRKRGRPATRWADEIVRYVDPHWSSNATESLNPPPLFKDKSNKIKSSLQLSNGFQEGPIRG